MGSKSQMLRDARNRSAVLRSEIQRRALLYISRNTTLENNVRHRAQLQLNAFAGETRPGRVSDRCLETGRGRGVMSQFGLCRVSRGGATGALGWELMRGRGTAVPIPVTGLAGADSGRAQVVVVMDARGRGAGL